MSDRAGPAALTLPEPPPAPGRGGRRAEWRAWLERAWPVWALALLCACGLLVLAWNFGGTLRVFPGPAVLSAFLLGVALYAGSALLRRVRPLRAPPRPWCWAAIGWGGTAATGCALLANSGLSAVWSRAGGVDFGSTWGAALTAPLNEEWLKTAGMVLLAVTAPLRLRGPLDGWVLGAFTGLGFQMVENWTYAMNGVLLAGATTPGDSALQSIIARLAFTGAGSHWTMSAVAGTGVGLLFAHSARPWRERLPPAVACLLTAMGMHWFFDAPVLGDVLGTAVKTGFDFLVALGFYLVLRGRFRHRARAQLHAPGVDGGAAVLLTRGSRRRARAAVPQGPERERYGRLMAAQLDLLEETAATGSPRPRFVAPLTERVAGARAGQGDRDGPLG